MTELVNKTIAIIKAFDLGREVIRAVTWLGCAYFATEAIGLLAGKRTEASFLVAYFTSKENDFGLPWVVAVIAMGYAYAERRLRYRKTEYLQGRIRELENRFDVNRTSSELTVTGETNPRDRL